MLQNVLIEPVSMAGMVGFDKRIGKTWCLWWKSDPASSQERSTTQGC